MATKQYKNADEWYASMTRDYSPRLKPGVLRRGVINQAPTLLSLTQPLYFPHIVMSPQRLTIEIRERPVQGLFFVPV